MEKIILGLLLMGSMTGYEIRSKIKSYFSLMCSASAGSFQPALQKLLVAGMITCEEYIEKSVNKKLYSITEDGRMAFFQWEEQPMNHKKVKNMEQAKLFFLGLIDSEKRESLLLSYIEQLAKERQVMLELKASIIESKDSQLKQIAVKKTEQDVFKYKMATLDLGIAALAFEIQWYQQFLQEIVGE